MELMGIVGIIVNCALIGQSGQVHRMFPHITSTQTIILVVILEVSYDNIRKYLSVILFRRLPIINNIIYVIVTF